MQVLEPARDVRQFPSGRRVLIPALTLGCALFLLVLLTPPIIIGDGPHYFAVTNSFVTQKTFAITPETEDFLSRWYKVKTPLGGGIEMKGLDGRRYQIHFPFYSALAGLYYQLFMGWTDVRLAFQLTNVTVFLVCALAHLVWGCGGLTSRVVALAFVFLGPVSTYLCWTGPEVMSASFFFLGLSLVLNGRLISGTCAISMASLQNPSIIFGHFVAIIVIGTELVHGMSAQTFSGRLRHEVKRLRTWAVLAGGLITLVPYVYSREVFGVVNPVGTMGYLTPETIDLRRFLSYLFDPNLGMVLAVPGVMLIAVVRISARIVRAIRRRTVRDLIRVHDSMLLVFVMAALPVLMQKNWNAGCSTFIRYASWGAVPLVLWAVRDWDVERVLGDEVSTLIVAILVQSLLPIYYGGIRIAPVDYLELKPWVKAVVAVRPGLYNPEPEIFAERVSGRDLGRPAAFPTVAYKRANGDVTKVLVSANRVDTVSADVCPAGQRLAGKGQPFEEILAEAPRRRGSLYLNGPFLCTPGNVPSPRQ